MSDDQNDRKDVKPWDLLNPREPRSEEELKAHRLSICEQCEHFRQTTKTCRLCGCFMELKTTLARAKCPDHRW